MAKFYKGEITLWQRKAFLKIETLGPLRNIEIAVQPFMFFIGPQASGKSTISKAVYFFKSLRDDLYLFVRDAIEKEDFDKHLGAYAKIIRNKFVEMWGPTFHLSELGVKYTYNQTVGKKQGRFESYHTDDDKSIELSLNEKGYVNVNFSKTFREDFLFIIEEAKKFVSGKTDFPKLSTAEIEAEEREFYTRLRQYTNKLFDDDRDFLFIPAGRSILATLSDQLQNIHPHSLDFTMHHFIKKINYSKKSFNKDFEQLIVEKKQLSSEKIDFDKVNFAKKIIKDILKGEYLFDKEGEKIYYDEEKYTKINFSSSGQQEAIWILLLSFLLILEKRKVFVVVEEPEAHLYPEAQKQIVDLMTLLANTQGNQMIITTHSPYILASVNNLIYAHKVAHNEEKKLYQTVEERINPYLWLDSANVGAFFVEKNHIKNIFDDQVLSIATEAIDSASRLINEDYNFLFEID